MSRRSQCTKTGRARPPAAIVSHKRSLAPRSMSSKATREP
jgi:hypothetical protein